MQIVAASPRSARAGRRAVLRGALVAALLVGAGVLIAWLVLATPIVARLQPGIRPTPVQTAVGVFAWTFAIIVPAGFVLLGLARVIGIVEHLHAMRPATHLARLARALDDRHLVATELRLPDGRRLHELVLGPFGIAVIGDAPPPHGSRVTGGRWEVRDRRGRWIPVESPVERASRDAERVRRWLGGDDQDFVVKIYAVVLSTDPRVTRSPSCAVVAPGELAAWLAALTPQRGLTPVRMEVLADLVRSLADG